MTSVIAIDQGTTGTKAHRLRDDGTFETIAAFEHRQIYPQQGWVEHDPEELARHVESALDQAGDASAIGIANQGETVVAWDADTKRPIHNAIVWQDARTADVTERLKADGAEELTLKLAGLPLDPYFSAAKLRWLLDNVPEAQAAAQSRTPAPRHQRFLLPRSPDRPVRDRRHHRLAHQPDESRDAAMGPAPGRPVRRAARLPAGDSPDRRRVRGCARHSGDREPGRSAGRLVRPRLPAQGRCQDHLRHRRLRARRRGQHRAARHRERPRSDRRMEDRRRALRLRARKAASTTPPLPSTGRAASACSPTTTRSTTSRPRAPSRAASSSCRR